MRSRRLRSSAPRGRTRRWITGRGLRLGALGAVLVGAIIIVGLHKHGHLHGDLRVITSDGSVMLVPEWRLTGEPAPQRLDPIQPGAFTFQLSNADGIPHDFLVVRTDADASALPTTGGQVDLENAGEVVGEISAVNPGAAGDSGQIVLEEGKYVLFCSLPGHYSGGMYYQLTVQ